ncbi:riboflavin synthase [Ferrovibrio sp.]|uniref:riboflavin synthase n=1 Tax=Ferrovibrio sp. TaxID=1917215 RepID=UPI002639D702|nr:riboflavin synthase [Ferrovibrio sp.]
MFTGIVTDIGTVTAREARGDTRFRIRTAYDTASIAIGASIACSGVCLTVVQKGDDWFAVDVSAETLSRTGLGSWSEGSRINLERSLKVGDELGGHIVSGHVDGVGEVTDVASEGDSLRIVIRAPDALAPFIAEKGSITLDGASLTVNSIETATFGVNLIPHTQQVTTLGSLKAGNRVNLEIDTLARYVARLQQWSKTA